RRNITDTLAQGCRHHLARPGRRGQGLARHHRACGSQHHLVRAHRQAADHNPLRIEDVYQNRQHLAEPPARGTNDSHRDRIAALRSRANVASRERPAMGRQNSAAPAHSRVFDGSHRYLLHPAAACPSLGGTALVMSDRPAAGESHMPNLSGEIVSAAVKLPINDDSCAKSRAHRDEDHVIESMPRAVAMLGDGAGVCVILDVAANAELPLEDCFDRNIHPRGKIGRRMDNPAQSIKRAATAYADAADYRARKPAALQERADSLNYQVERAVGALGGNGSELETLAHLGQPFRDDDRRLGATDIDTDPDFCGHANSPSTILVAGKLYQTTTIFTSRCCKLGPALFYYFPAASADSGNSSNLADSNLVDSWRLRILSYGSRSAAVKPAASRH